MSFCSVLFFWNQLWLSFFVSQQGNESFFRKSNFLEAKKYFCSYSRMNILLFCVFTFRVDCEMYSFVENEKYLCLGEDGTICSSFKINTTSWVLHVTKKMSDVSFWLCTSHIDHDMFCFLMAGMTGAGWCYRSGTLSTLFGNAP